MTNPVITAARAAARRLEADAEPGLAAEVDAILATRGARPAPPQYSDAIALASLIVSIASLAWTVYTDLRKRTARPDTTMVAQTVEARLRDNGQVAPGHVLDVVVTEAIRAAEGPSDA